MLWKKIGCGYFYHNINIFIMRFLSKMNAFSFNTKLKLLVILSTYVACSIRYSFVNLCQSPKVHLQIGSVYAHEWIAFLVVCIWLEYIFIPKVKNHVMFTRYLFMLQFPFYSNRSLSYVFVTTGMAFLLMAFVYVLVDFKHVWQGEPFLFAGKSKDCNSINRFWKK